MARVASDHYPEKILHETGGLYASIYRCHGRQGEYFVTQFSRMFTFDDKTHVTDRFRREHLLPLAHLAERAYAVIKALKTGD